MGRRGSTICITRTKCSPRRHRTIAPGSRPCRSAHRGHVTSNCEEVESLFFLTKKDFFFGVIIGWLCTRIKAMQVSCGITWLLTVGRRDHYFFPDQKKTNFRGHFWITLRQNQGHAAQLWGHVTCNCGDEGLLFFLTKKRRFFFGVIIEWLCTRIKASQVSWQGSRDF